MSDHQTTALAAKILVVDDARASSELLVRILRKRGYVAIPVIDSCRTIATARAESPDLILLDIIMPGLDGYEVCSLLKADERTRDIPVVFISAKDEIINKVKAFSLGGIDYITKPFQMQEVMARIENQLKIQELQKKLAEQNVRLLQEISDRDLAEIALQQELERSNLLREITDKIRSELDSQKIFETAATQIGKAFGVSRGLIHTYVAQQTENLPVMGEYLAYNNYTSLQNISIPVRGNPHAEQLLLRDKAIASNDVYSEPLLQPVVSLCEQLEIKSMLAVRTSYKGEPNGIIGLHQCDRYRKWTEAEIELLESVAQQLGMAIAQAALLEQEKQARAELALQNTQLQQEIRARLQVEEALRKSEVRFRLLADNSIDLISRQTAKGIYTYASPACQTLLGYTPSELIGRNIYEFFHPEDLTKIQHSYSDLLFNCTLNFTVTYRIRHRDGHYIWFETTSHVVRDVKTGKILEIQAASRDITSRKQLEEQLAQSEKFLTSIVENIPLALFVKDVANDYRFVLWNKTCEKMFGGSRSEIIGRNDYDMFPKEQADFLRSKDLEVVAQNKLVEIPCEPIDSHTQGRKLLRTIKVPISNAGKVTHLLGISEDITKRMRQENALQLIVEGTASTTGDNFMRSCVRYLAEVLQVRYAVIGKWGNEDCTKVKTLAFWSGETWIEGSIEYEIEYTPCGRALEGEMYYCPENLQEVFPNNRMLFELKSQSYLGMPLRDSEGNIIGQLAIMDVLPMKYDPSRESILKIFAARVGAELERQQVEEELRESEERLQLAIAASRDGIFDFNLEKNSFYYSPQWRSTIGYPLNAPGLNLEELLAIIHPDDLGLVRGILEEILIGVRSQWQVEFRMLHQDGDWIWVLSRGEANRNESGKVIRISGTHTDISDRKALEEELALREAQLNSFFNCAPVGLTIVDEQLRSVQINERLAEINGKSVQDCIGKTLQEILPDVAVKLEPLYKQVLATGEPILNQEISRELPSKPGILRHWIVSYFPILGENDRPLGVGGILVEITDRKQAELELRLANERLEHLLIYSPVVIFSSKVDGDCPITFISENVTAILGYSAREVLSDASFWRKHVHPEDVDRVFAELAQMSEHEYRSLEYRVRHFEGNYRWVCNQIRLVKDSAGKPIEVVGYSIDISSRKQIEEELLESAERERALATAIQRMRETLDIETIFAATTYELRQVIKCDRVGVYRFYPDWSGEFVAESVGSEWLSLLQAQIYNPDLVKDTYLQENKGGAYNSINSRAVEDIYSAQFTSCYVNFLERLQVRAYIIVPILCGSKLWGLLATYQNSAPRQWKAAEINIAVQIGNQLGVALQQAELLEQTKKQSAALQKAVLVADAANRAKSEFLANMSHELRTPLNAILGFTQLMNRDSSISPEDKQNLAIINRAGEHLLDLINDILEMSKIEAGRTTLTEKTFDLLRLLDNLEKMLRLKAEAKGLKLLFKYAPALPRYVRTDSIKLRQVLLNLLGNAIKFTESGTVTLRVSIPQEGKGKGKGKGREEGGGNSSHSPFPIPYSLYFEVEDTGSGISSEEMSLLFEAFVQTSTGKKSQQGTGLGLPISRKYVQLMGGDIKVASTPGKGSLFAFDIKISSADADVIPTTEKQLMVIGLAPNQPEYRILVVDDISESRLLLVKLLQSIGFCLLEAQNGLEAVTLWESWQPTLIFMDMQMPVMDGYEATKQIRAREKSGRSPLAPLSDPPPRPPLRRGGASGISSGGRASSTVIIAFTASAFSEQRQTILSAGCDDFVSKPFQEEALLSKISQHLAVQYVYEEETAATEDDSEQTNSVFSYETDLPNLIGQMPESWVAQVHDAAAQGSDSLILQLLKQIPPENTLLADALTNLANNFQFAQVMKLTQQDR